MSDLTQNAPKAEVIEIVRPLNEDGSPRRGARYRQGENYKTGSSQTRQSQEEYVEWLVTPKALRKPQTKTALAAELGVTLRTLNLWEKTPFVMKEVSRRTKNQAKVQNAGDVLEALLITAKDTSSARQVSAAKVYLDYIDDSVEEITAEELADLSNEELAEMLAKVHDLILEEQGGD